MVCTHPLKETIFLRISEPKAIIAEAGVDEHVTRVRVVERLHVGRVDDA